MAGKHNLFTRYFKHHRRGLNDLFALSVVIVPILVGMTILSIRADDRQRELSLTGQPAVGTITRLHGGGGFRGYRRAYIDITYSASSFGQQRQTLEVEPIVQERLAVGQNISLLYDAADPKQIKLRAYDMNNWVWVRYVTILGLVCVVILAVVSAYKSILRRWSTNK